jgi:release factor glutamine methyltransferase
VTARPMPTRLRRKRRLERARRLVRTRLGTQAWSKQFELVGRRWVLLEGVFSPIETPVTGMFTSWLPYPVGGSLLEIGCGTGVTSVHAVLEGCDHVVAVDINDNAVENTRLNAQRHGVSNRISVRHGDLYEALGPDERFDLIYWSSSFIDAPDDHVFQSELDYAYFDPGYRVHRRYLLGAAAHLTRGGRLLLGFSNLGNWDELGRACAEAGLEPTVLRREFKYPGSKVEFQLLELSAPHQD